MTGISDAALGDRGQKQISREATDWLIYLQDDPDDAALQARFAAWLAQSPDHARAWDATTKTAGLMTRAVATSPTNNTADWQVFLQKTRAAEGVGSADTADVNAINAPDAQNASRGAVGAAGTVAARKAMNADDAGPSDQSIEAGIGGAVVINADDAFAKARPRNTARAGGVAAGRKPYRRRWPAFTLAGIAVAASLLLAVMGGPGIATRMMADYSTGTGETRTVTLQDGSQVVLAPESAIRVNFAGQDRRVELLDGEAFFEVTHNANKPFRVRSNAVNVTVLGTGFDVSDANESTFVAVAHGLVRVDNPTATPAISELLEPGQSIRVHWKGGMERFQVPDGYIAPWRQQQLIAQDQPLGIVVDQLRRYYGGRIFITDGDLANLPVTGVYNLKDPVSALRAIARAQNAVVREITPWMLVVSAG